MSYTRYGVTGLLSLLIFVGIASQKAFSFPDGPITVIVPFNAGGGTDRQARMVEQEFKQEFGQPLVFVYKPGASGSIGATEVAQAKPDGSTIGVYTFPLMVMNALTGKGRYDIESFDYLAVASSDDVVLVTRKESPYKSLDELVAAAKSNPGKLSIGTVESLGPTHLAALSLKDSGVNINVVPLPGGAKGLAAVLGGHVDALFALRGATRSSASKFNYLAIARADRLKDASDLPTFKENGFDIVYNATRIWIAPKGLPKEVRDRLIEGLSKIYAREEVQQKHAKAGQFVAFQDGKKLQSLVTDFYPKAKDMLVKHGQQ